MHMRNRARRMHPEACACFAPSSEPNESATSAKYLRPLASGGHCAGWLLCRVRYAEIDGHTIRTLSKKYGRLGLPPSLRNECVGSLTRRANLASAWQNRQKSHPRGAHSTSFLTAGALRPCTSYQPKNSFSLKAAPVPTKLTAITTRGPNCAAVKGRARLCIWPRRASDPSSPRTHWNLCQEAYPLARAQCCSVAML